MPPNAASVERAPWNTRREFQTRSQPGAVCHHGAQLSLGKPQARSSSSAASTFLLKSFSGGGFLPWNGDLKAGLCCFIKTHCPKRVRMGCPGGEKLRDYGECPWGRCCDVTYASSAAHSQVVLPGGCVLEQEACLFLVSFLQPATTCDIRYKLNSDLHAFILRARREHLTAITVSKLHTVPPIWPFMPRPDPVRRVPWKQT